MVLPAKKSSATATADSLSRSRRWLDPAIGCRPVELNNSYWFGGFTTPRSASPAAPPRKVQCRQSSEGAADDPWSVMDFSRNPARRYRASLDRIGDAASSETRRLFAAHAAYAGQCGDSARSTNRRG